jgi:hypothetical protein
MVDARGTTTDYADLVSRLRTNADYDTPPVTSTAKAYLYIAACREFLIKFEETEKGQRYKLRFNHTEVRKTLERAESWVDSYSSLDSGAAGAPASGYMHVDLREFRE